MQESSCSMLAMHERQPRIQISPHQTSIIPALSSEGISERQNIRMAVSYSEGTDSAKRVAGYASYVDNESQFCFFVTLIHPAVSDPSFPTSLRLFAVIRYQQPSRLYVLPTSGILRFRLMPVKGTCLLGRTYNNLYNSNSASVSALCITI
jgi:hypothetical protein